jgi:succinate dehydrogenase/fumarate reductase flavoprotein subunit
MFEEESQTCDLVIVGAGLAGLVAGVRAAELGLRPLVLEKGSGADYPCNSRQSGGILHIGFHDPYRDADDLTQIIMRLTDGEAQPDLAAALASNTSRLISWLQEKGARFMRFNQLEGYKWCMAPPRALRAGIDWKGRGPDIVLRKLVKELDRLGGVLLPNARARKLVMRDGRCAGVEGELDGKPAHWPARAVLIADGGFQSNPTLFEEHIGPNFGAAFQRNAGSGIGDGLLMAKAAGAKLTATNRFYGHVLCADAAHNDQVWPYPELDAVATSGIVVNSEGHRVVDEGRTGVYLANALATLPTADTTFAIFDAGIWEGPGKSARIPANPLLEKAGGTIHRADSLEELAGQIGVPADRLAQTLSDYHQALKSGTFDTLDVPRSRHIAPHPVDQPPFMAIKLLPGITYTMGGIAIDGDARVIATDGQPIPHLYAAGAATGGIEGGTNAVYIGGLVKAGTFGMLAAEHVAATLRPNAPLTAPAGIQAAPHPVSPAGEPQGMARYPMLKATLRYGHAAALILGAATFLVSVLISWSFLWLLSIPVSAILAAVIYVAIRSYTELVRMITDLLMPE